MEGGAEAAKAGALLLVSEGEALLIMFTRGDAAKD